MPSCDAILFDLGRVLVRIDTGRGIFAQLTALSGDADPAAMIARLVQDELFIAYNTGRITPVDFHAQVCARLGLRLPYDDFRRVWCDIFEDQPGMDALLQELAPRIRLGLLSDTDPLHWEHILAHFPYVARIPAPTLSFQTQVMKPEPGAYLAAAEKVGVEPSRCLFIDDLQQNVKGARAVGMDAVQFVDMDTLRGDLRARGCIPDGGTA